MIMVLTTRVFLSESKMEMNLLLGWRNCPGVSIHWTGKWTGIVEWTIALNGLWYFCLGTGVPRHSAGGVGTFICTYVRTWYVSFAMRMRE